MLPSSVEVPRPSSSTRTKVAGAAARTSVAVSSISAMKEETPAAGRSDAPVRAMMRRTSGT